MWIVGFANDLCGNLAHGHERTAESVGLEGIVDKVCPDRSLGRGERKSEAGKWISQKISPLLDSPENT